MKITAESVNTKTTSRKTSSPQNKRPKNHKQKDKKDKQPMALRDKLIVGVIVVVTIVGGIFVKNTFFPTVETPPVVDEPTDKPKEDVPVKETPKVENGDPLIDKAAESFQDVTAVISAADSADAKARLQEGLDYVISLNGADFIPTRCAAWQNTLPARASEVQTALTLGYTMDVENSQWFDGKAEQNNLYQFVVKMHKEGAEDIAFNGQYVTGTRAIQILYLVGDMDTSSLASPGDGPQANDLGTE